MDNGKIGQMILKKRKEKNLTQEELAKRINVSSKTISKWECGDMIPNSGSVKKLCKELNISFKELINGENSKSVLTEEKCELLFSNIKINRRFPFKDAFIVCMPIFILMGFALMCVMFFYCAEILKKITESLNVAVEISAAEYFSLGLKIGLWFIPLLIILILMIGYGTRLMGKNKKEV